MKRIIYGSLSTLLLTVTAIANPTFTLQANAQTSDINKTCRQETYKPITAGGHFNESLPNNRTDDMNCQSTHLSDASTQQEKTCSRQVSSFSPVVSGGVLVNSGFGNRICQEVE